MGRIKKPGGKKGSRQAVLLCLYSLAFLGAIGCSTTNKTKGDPLMGEFGPKGEVKPPATKTSSNQVPPIPLAGYGINTANLAAGTLPGSQTLAIGQPQAADKGPGSLTAGSKDKTTAVLTPVVQPVPKDDSPVVPATNWDKGQQPPPNPLLTQAPASNPPPSPGQTPNNPPQGLTWPNVNLAKEQVPPSNPPPPPPPPGQAPVDPLQGQLKAHGVTWQRAENVSGGVKFTCIVPNPQNPQVSRAYEAIGPDYPAAVRAVLWEIDNKR